MGACASSSRGRSNHGKNQKSAKVAAIPSTPVAQVGRAAASSEEKSIFTWRIDGFSSLLDKQKGWTSSRYFEISNLKWYLQLNLKDRRSGDYREYVSLVLVLSKTSDLKPDIIVDASFKLLICDQEYGRHSEHEFSHQFQTTESSRRSGNSCMILIDTLKEPSSGFIVGDSCVFGVELIKLTTAKAKDSSGMLLVQKINDFSARKAYTWVIDDFLILKGRCSSPVFEICGRKWYLNIYPSGIDGSEEFLTLYLHMAKPPHGDASLQNSWVLVEVNLSIKDKVTSNRNTWIKGRCQFKFQGTEEGDGGWAKFMWTKSVKDCYLVKGSCLIEADVAIVGSSKME